MDFLFSSPFLLTLQRFGRNNLYGQDENQDQLTSVLVRKLRFELDQIL